VGNGFAVLSGLTLLVLLLTIPVVATLPWLFSTERLQDLSAASFLLVFALSVTYGAATGLVPAVALARFALRIWPLDASEMPRRGCVAWQRRLGYAVVLFFLLDAIGIIWMRLAMEGYFSPGEPAEGRGFVFLFASTWAGWGMTIAGAAALSSWAHSHPGYFRRRPFILYLRRFSGFADRTIVAEVLKAAPPGVPVVFIASPQSVARNWDPFVWAFAGLRLRHPLLSLPVQLRTSDEEWEKTIASLAAKAAMVVMDVTERSPSVEREAGIVAQQVQAERVICLADRRARLPSQAEHATPSQIAGGGSVLYERRWAWFPLAMKMGLFAFVAYGIFFGTLALPKLAKGQNEITVTLLFALIALIGLWLLVAAVLLLRPSIDQQARQTLRKRLAQPGA
jgi:hypothetical protein